jgi:hypothetical protein
MSRAVAAAKEYFFLPKNFRSIRDATCYNVQRRTGADVGDAFNKPIVDMMKHAFQTRPEMPAGGDVNNYIIALNEHVVNNAIHWIESRLVPAAAPTPRGGSAQQPRSPNRDHASAVRQALAPRPDHQDPGGDGEEFARETAARRYAERADRGGGAEGGESGGMQHASGAHAVGAGDAAGRSADFIIPRTDQRALPTQRVEQDGAATMERFVSEQAARQQAIQPDEPPQGEDEGPPHAGAGSEPEARTAPSQTAPDEDEWPGSERLPLSAVDAFPVFDDNYAAFEAAPAPAAPKLARPTPREQTARSVAEADTKNMVEVSVPQEPPPASMTPVAPPALAQPRPLGVPDVARSVRRTTAAAAQAPWGAESAAAVGAVCSLLEKVANEVSGLRGRIDELVAFTGRQAAHQLQLEQLQADRSLQVATALGDLLRAGCAHAASVAAQHAELTTALSTPPVPAQHKHRLVSSIHRDLDRFPSASRFGFGGACARVASLTLPSAGISDTYIHVFVNGEKHAVQVPHAVCGSVTIELGAAVVPAKLSSGTTLTTLRVTDVLGNELRLASDRLRVTTYMQGHHHLIVEVASKVAMQNGDLVLFRGMRCDDAALQEHINAGTGHRAFPQDSTHFQVPIPDGLLVEDGSAAGAAEPRPPVRYTAMGDVFLLRNAVNVLLDAVT